MADVISMATMGDFTHLFEASIGLDHQATNKMGIRSNTMRIDGEIMIDAGLLMPHLRTAKIVEYIYILYIYTIYINILYIYMIFNITVYPMPRHQTLWCMTRNSSLVSNQNPKSRVVFLLN